MIGIIIVHGYNTTMNIFIFYTMVVHNSGIGDKNDKEV